MGRTHVALALCVRCLQGEQSKQSEICLLFLDVVRRFMRTICVLWVDHRGPAYGDECDVLRLPLPRIAEHDRGTSAGQMARSTLFDVAMAPRSRVRDGEDFRCALGSSLHPYSRQHVDGGAHLGGLAQVVAEGHLPQARDGLTNPQALTLWVVAQRHW